MSGPISPGLLLPSIAYRPPQMGQYMPSKNVAISRLRVAPNPEDSISDTGSEIEDDLPTPKAVAASRSIVSPPSSARYDSLKAVTVSNPNDGGVDYDARTDDELYTISSDDDSEIIPIKISNSVKRMVTQQQQPPPLMLPPMRTMAKTGLSRRNASNRRSRHQTPLSPAALARLHSLPQRVSSRTSAPSLAESMTSEEPSFTDPETPDLRSDDDFSHGWEMPIQLSPKAMSTLHNLAVDATAASIDSIVGAKDLRMHEMKDRGLHISVIAGAQQLPYSDEIEPMSAISVPSPGGFFASLPATIQSVWSAGPDPDVPSTSVAKSFYNVPWAPRSSSITTRFVEIDDSGTEGPPTARRLVLSPRHVEDVAEQRRQHEYDESYDHKLYQEASSKLNRTSLWLSQLQGCDSDVGRTIEHQVQHLTASPELLGPASPPPIAALPPAPTSGVRAAHSHDSLGINTKTVSSSLLYNAFQHLYSPSPPNNDAFTHRQPRYDAIQTQRLYSQQSHIAQLSSNFPSSMFAARSNDEDSFSHLASQPTTSGDANAKTLQTANSQKKAIDAISLNVWNLQAQRLLSGDNLLPRSARTALRLAGKAGMTPMILDLGGQPTADWAWAVAGEYREGKVYTAVVPGYATAMDDAESFYTDSMSQDASHSDAHRDADWKAHKGPSNHRVVQVSAPWKLPFADETFDVVSARSLYQLCRLRNTTPGVSPTKSSRSRRSRTSATYIPGQSNDSDFDTEDEGPSRQASITRDEWDATLAEVHRVLVPGGVLAFDIFDAEIKNLDAAGMPGISCTAGDHAQNTAALAARSADFVGLLERSGYDAAASGTFVARLVDAGFGRVERAWLSLAVDQKMMREGDNSGDKGKDPSMQSVTGLLGSLTWEKWMLKVQRESGRDAGRFLNGVGQALEGARKDGRKDSKSAIGWTMLVGACRKAGGGKRSTS